MEGGCSRYYNVKMRSERGGRHASGAERLVDARRAARTAAALAMRAMERAGGAPDSVNVKLVRCEEPLRIPALPVSEYRAESPAQATEYAAGLLAKAGVSRAAELLEIFRGLHGMRGAALVDADTLERLDSDPGRGVRVTALDASPSLPVDSCGGKDHFAEAAVLSAKVLAAPGIIGEICVSDDIGYTTGYVTVRGGGYHRIFGMKAPDATGGGRMFLYRGPREDAAATVRWLESRPVAVEGVRPPPPARESRMDGIRGELRAIADAGLERSLRVLESRTGTRASCGGRELAVFSSNDYLGLAGDPRVAAAAARAAGEWGAGTGGSRLVTGTQAPHAAFERQMAAFKGAEDCVSFATGYMANVGAISAIASKGDAVYSDELNHASIVDGCRLSGAHVEVFRHRDMADLEDRLSFGRAFRRRLVVSDGIFSMDGDMADLPAILALCRKYDAFSMIDEAHATGVAGRGGRGLCEHFGCALPDIASGTMSKALGSEGGFVCASREIAALLRQKARPFIFSTSPAAASLFAASAALSILESEPWRVEKLRANVELFVSSLPPALRPREKPVSAIVPVMAGAEARASAAAEELLRRGFLIPAIRWPSVPRGQARLRVTLSCAHVREDVVRAAKAVAEALG